MLLHSSIGVQLFNPKGGASVQGITYVDIEWQRTFLMIVAIELLHTTEPGETS